MSGIAPKLSVPKFPDAKFSIITARWHPEICDALVAGAQRALHEAGVAKVEVINVPGSFELPLAAKYALTNGADAAVVLGVGLGSETPHFDCVCQGVTSRVMHVSLESSKPIGFGVLTVDTIEQAAARSGQYGDCRRA